MGPCLCGDPYCGSCGDPGLMAAIDAEIDRTEARIGEGFEGLAECSCGRRLIDSDDPNGRAIYLYRVCMDCHSADNPDSTGDGPDYSDPDFLWAW